MAMDTIWRENSFVYVCTDWIQAAVFELGILYSTDSLTTLQCVL